MMEELEFILNFIKRTDFGYDVCRKQLRSLWTAYCFHTDIECDTRKYDNDIRTVYSTLEKNTSYPWSDIEDDGIIGFELFDMFMGEELS